MTIKQAAAICEATLNYVPSARGGTGGATKVTIHDGRTAELPGWQECGFELQQHRSAVRNWSDDEEIGAVHYAEMAELAERLSGCDHALVAGHIKRGPEHAARHRDLNPISLVHSDFADTYGEKIRDRYRNVSEESSAALTRAGITAEQAAGARRILVLQFWRNLGPAKMDHPLAFCDVRTVPREQIRAFPVTNYAGSGFNFDALAVVAPDDPGDNDWYAFMELGPDEVVAFRTYDTELVENGGRYWTPHSAFRDPDVEVGKPSRSSIELRATCLWL